MKYREVLNEVQPKAAAIAAIAAAVIAAGASVYGGGKAAAAKRKAKRVGGNANQMANGGMDASAPTASRFAGEGLNQGAERGGGGARLSGTLGGGKLGDSMPASHKEQGFSLGMKSLSESVPEGSQSFQSGAASADPQTSMPITKIEEPPPTQPQPQPEQASGADAAGSYASIASSLLGAYQASQGNRMEPKPAATVGPMNLTPSALRYGQR